ncbi:MAG: hypothetical protein JXA79_03470 [Deltaproteobacteria bacterium]|nr:hypothetical protein [Deltaproteobacteria bacterium]
MKKEYDFSEGERGKFYRPDLKLNLPIYLDPETRSFIEKIAKKKKTDLSTVVNDLIKTDMQIAEFVK